ncbi:hypothetical protein JNK62_04350 [bacterium]|nr:hypothetical protein [bacterium]
MTRRITRRVAMNRIRRRIETGLSMRYLDVLNSDPALLKTVQRFFPEGWKKAVRITRATDLPRRRKVKRPIDRRAEVIRRIQDRHASGKSISSKDLRREEPALLSMALRQFEGSLEKAIEASGFSYAEVRKRLPKPKPYWSKALVVERMRERAASGRDLNIGAVRKDDEALYLAGMRHFKGSWKAVIEATGFTYDRVKKGWIVRYWSKKLVIVSIRARARAGYSLSHGDMEIEDSPLLEAGYRYFGTWENAVEKAGIPYDTVIKVWQTKRRIKHLRPFLRSSDQEN